MSKREQTFLTKIWQTYAPLDVITTTCFCCCCFFFLVDSLTGCRGDYNDLTHLPTSLTNIHITAMTFPN